MEALDVDLLNPEKLIKSYIEEVEARARGHMVAVSPSRVANRYGIKSFNAKLRIAKLLPRIAERYGYKPWTSRKKRDGGKLYVKSLSGRSRARSRLKR